MADESMRGTGRTTAAILRAVADALDNPGLTVEFHDHEDDQGQGEMSVAKAERIHRAIVYVTAKMGLRHFEVRRVGQLLFLRSTVLEERGQ